MAYEIVMPQLGLSVDSGKIVKWLKQPGENVQAGEILLEVESDKTFLLYCFSKPITVKYSVY